MSSKASQEFIEYYGQEFYEHLWEVLIDFEYNKTIAEGYEFGYCRHLGKPHLQFKGNVTFICPLGRPGTVYIEFENEINAGSLFNSFIFELDS